MRDLVGIDVRPADIFPADDSGYGFDNIGDVLTIPRQTLLRIDTLLYAFFKPEHQGVRYA